VVLLEVTKYTGVAENISRNNLDSNQSDTETKGMYLRNIISDCNSSGDSERNASVIANLHKLQD
jgi:hypothetical protein